MRFFASFDVFWVSFGEFWYGFYRFLHVFSRVKIYGLYGLGNMGNLLAEGQRGKKQAGEDGIAIFSYGKESLPLRWHCHFFLLSMYGKESLPLVARENGKVTKLRKF